MHWQSEDLSLFTPASAPVLPTAKVQSYESSIAAHSRSKGGSTTPVSTKTSNSAQTSNPKSKPAPSIDNGLSTGAKAGIGVGVAAAVLILIAIGFILLRRRKKSTKSEPSEQPHRAVSKRAYMDDKSELPANERRTQELPAERDPQEFPTSRDPPPVPLASKPKFAEPQGRNNAAELA